MFDFFFLHFSFTGPIQQPQYEFPESFAWSRKFCLGHYYLFCIYLVLSFKKKTCLTFILGLPWSLLRLGPAVSRPRSGSMGEQLKQLQPPRFPVCVAHPAAHAVPEQHRAVQLFLPLSSRSPVAAASSPGIWPQQAAPCSAVVGAGTGGLQARGEVAHGVCCLISSQPVPGAERTQTARGSAGKRCLRDKQGKENTSIFASLGLRRSFICWHFPGAGSAHNTIHLRSQTPGSQLPFRARGVSPGLHRGRMR